ncbi:MAG: phosphatidate cytidylyltransferase [Prevotellamassilia sp.]|nr:phosphatidate cytidylyltransferase [Prevotellamassilia sp.]
MSNLVVRSLTGIVFVAVLVGGTLYSPLTFTVLFALITGLSVWEFSTNVNNHAGASVNRLINTVAGVYLFLAFSGYCADFVKPDAFIPYLVSIMYLLISELYLQKRNPLKNWAYAFASQIYVALAFSLLNVLAFQYNPLINRTEFLPIYALSIFIFLWTSDSGAYLCGSMLHKYFPAKLFPRISPNKSWVGSIGGGLLCLVAATLLWHFNPGTLPLLHWLGLCLTVCVFGTWGDLVESLFKRQLGIKDSGHVLPGHGGMLDRFDSSLLAIPAAVLYLYTIQAF